MSAKKIETDAALDDEIASGITVIDFWATWCQPCKTMAPIVDELAAELALKGIKVVKADIEQAMQGARKAGVRAVPSFVIYKDGQKIGVKAGQAPKAALQAWIDQTIAA
jgi:thioredoxin 1